MKKNFIFAALVAIAAFASNAKTDVATRPTESWPATDAVTRPAESWPVTEATARLAESWPVESWPVA